MIFFYYGTDSFRVREGAKKRIGETKAAFGWPQEHREVRVAPEDENPDRVFELLDTRGLFDREKIVCIEQLGGFTEEFREAIRTRAEKGIKNDKNTILLLTHIIPSPSGKRGRGGNADDAIVRAFADYITRERFDVLEGVSLSAWITQYANDLGVTIPQGAADLLASAHPGKTAMIARELEKLSLYARESSEKNPEITRELIMHIGWQETRQDAFQIVSALGARGEGSAIRVFLRAIASGENVVKLLGLITYVVRSLLSVKDAQSRPFRADEIPGITGLAEWQVRQYAGAAARFRVEDLERLFERLAVTDYKIKTGEGNPRMLIERLLLSI